MRNKHEICSTRKALTQIHISLTKVKSSCACVCLPLPPLLHALGQGKRDLTRSEKSFQELSTWTGPCPLMNRRPIYLAAFCLLLLLPSLSPTVPPSLLSLI